LTNLNLNPKLSQNNTPTQQQQIESKNRNTTPATLKTPVQPKDDTKGVDITQRTIEVADTAVINNERITPLVAFQFRPPSKTSEFSVSKAHQNISEALKTIRPNP